MNTLPSDVHPDMPVLFIFMRYKFAKFELFRICVVILPTACSSVLLSGFFSVLVAMDYGVVALWGICDLGKWTCVGCG